ncbi:spermidine hydroxycinnamoyl transferase-like [Silene latifolia]|uniref:spermidine hydroxycinnamoyl transferase-like n=1 Tax=Silene latifolia TaxID=37657 RepID=UPI003D7826E4
MGVTIKSKHVVTPAEPTWNGILPLSELDQVGELGNSSVLYFYDRPHGVKWDDPSKNMIIETLKDSLSRALVPFYPLAGRLSWIEGNRLQLDCNAKGGELIEADSTKKLSEFGNFVDSSISMFQDLISHIDYTNTPIEELPLLSVQVTRFACGGICLGMQTSHVITDGRCAFHFYKEWARLAQGDQIESLKKVANHEMLSSRPYSRFEVLTAHAWRCMTRARALAADRISPLYFIADGRSRLNPPLPSSYFGNAVIPVIACSCAGELLSRPLSYACSKVREAVELLSSDYIKGTIESLSKVETLSDLQYMDDRGKMIGNSKSLPEQNMWVTTWLNVLPQGLDFGWGHEVYAGPPTGVCGYRNTMILPHYRNDAAIKLAIWLKRNDKPLKFFDF